MISKGEIERINELYKKSKSHGLSNGEKKEQQILRSKYIDWIKFQVKSQIENIQTEKCSDVKYVPIKNVSYKVDFCNVFFIRESEKYAEVQLYLILLRNTVLI